MKTKRSTQERRVRLVQSYCLILALLLFIGVVRCQNVVEDDDANQETFRVVITFDDASAATSFAQALQQTTISSTEEETKKKTLHKKVIRHRRTNSVAATLTWDELQEFHSLYSSSIVEIEQDTVSQRFAESIPYGITAVQGDQPGIPLPSKASNNNCFKICVVDDGLLVEHDDIPYSLEEDGTSPHIQGRAFGLDPELDWYNPSSRTYHGTHVTGTIIAQGFNDIGVFGVIPQPIPGICLLIARVFDEEGDQDTSVILEAMEWCADEGARVINLSLGTNERNQNAEQMCNELEAEGILLVGAAGNDGRTRYAYPASFESVVSVGATDVNNTRADWSRYNDAIDLVAPGSDVISTSSFHYLRLQTGDDESGDSVSYETAYIDDGGELEEFPVTLELVDCMKGLEPNCTEDQAGKTCLIERGDSYFYVKALNCQNGGGVVALIYNNEPGTFSGYLGDDTGVEIPVIALSREGGLELKDRLESRDNDDVVSITFTKASYGYDSLDGTSFSVPHVVGVAAKIWAVRPECTHAQIREALQESALPLGTNHDRNGRNNEYGHGLVQAVDAYHYLLENFERPCGWVGSEAPTGSPTTHPSESPTPAPSFVPSQTPSSQPTQVPSASPTTHPSESPSQAPSFVPSQIPSLQPTQVPSLAPTTQPSESQSPSSQPTTSGTLGITSRSTWGCIIGFILMVGTDLILQGIL